MGKARKFKLLRELAKGFPPAGEVVTDENGKQRVTINAYRKMKKMYNEAKRKGK